MNQVKVVSAISTWPDFPRGNKLPGKGKVKSKKVKKARTVSEKLRAVVNNWDQLNLWERQFAKDMDRLVYVDRKLSPKQAEKLDQIYRKVSG
ncbi:MAG: hypothetical protein HQK57_02230 [Deltaproteobacteria bacterium]|nr:hypothetical protein [Deltaproteobacteria bacterium]